MTLQQQASHAISIMPEDKLPALIEFANYLLNSDSKATSLLQSKKHGNSILGKAKGKIWIADDFNATPDGFEDYV